jgi:hypothetical protein
LQVRFSAGCLCVQVTGFLWIKARKHSGYIWSYRNIGWWKLWAPHLCPIMLEIYEKINNTLCLQLYHKKGLFPVLRPQDFGMGCLDSFLVESKYLGTNLLGRGLVRLQCAKIII